MIRGVYGKRRSLAIKENNQIPVRFNNNDIREEIG